MPLLLLNRVSAPTIPGAPRYAGQFRDKVTIIHRSRIVPDTYGDLQLAETSRDVDVPCALHPWHRSAENAALRDTVIGSARLYVLPNQLIAPQDQVIDAAGTVYEVQGQPQPSPTPVQYIRAEIRTISGG